MRRVAVSRGLDARGVGVAGEQADGRHIVAGNGFANLLEDGGGSFVMKGFAETGALELMRKNAQEIEIGARAHDFRAFAEELNFAGGIGDGAVFLVSGGGGENDVSDLGGVGHEHVVADGEFDLAASRAKRAEMRERVRAHDVERFELAGLRGFDDLRRGEAGLRGNYRAPEPVEYFA